MTGEDWAAALVAAAICGLAGLLVPALIRAVPEPEPEPPPEDADPEAPEAEPKVPYAEVAAAPGLAWKAAIAAALAGGVVGWSVGWEWPLLYLVPLVPVGVALAVVDWRTRYLPTRIIAPTYAGLVRPGRWSAGWPRGTPTTWCGPAWAGCWPAGSSCCCG